jgi:uncharacterized protein YdeI (YjbR/CyaY-like superfamily)
MGFEDTAAREHFEDSAQWRRWLEVNHGTSAGVFVVSWRAATAKPAMSYDEMVEQALCFGWIDSRAQRLDDDRTMLWFTPRRAGSGWSRSNKERIRRLTDAGLLRPAGRAAVEAAHADGSWNLLDETDTAEVPDDLRVALAASPGAENNFSAFSLSARRSILSWILVAKTPGTRARRIAETVEKAARGEKANQWTRRTFS